MFRSLLILASIGLVAADNGINAWLRYAPLPQALTTQYNLPSGIVVLNSTKTSPVYTAGQELQKGIQGLFGKQLNFAQVDSDDDNESSIVVGTVDDYRKAYGDDDEDIPDIDEDGFWLNAYGDTVQILGQNERGALYGAFEYLSRLAQVNFEDVSNVYNPNAPIRWTNEWDNLDGSIERGFAGPSIFFNNGIVVQNLTRAAQYARILASIRINGVVVNNVNANASILTDQNIEGLGRIADVFRPYGVQLGLSLNFASPQLLGNLSTFDPLDPMVIQWWDQNITAKIYKRIPDMGGYLVKANSEGQPGPLTYNRTLAQGANLFARAVAPYGGIVMFRAFVYDNHINESNWYNDRANAQVDFFRGLDGQFDDNVIVQIKYGPIDFQVREPTSPLFGYLHNTSTAIELQITQEYTGQQTHLFYWAPLWKTVLDFDLRVDNKTSVVGRDIISGERFKRPLGGGAGVVNVGTNTTWLGSHLSMSNLYAYGRLMWDPTEDAQDILQDWIRLTFGLDRKVINTITQMSMESWPAYENYTGNLGIQTLTDILYTHFGPNPASQDNNGWGQWTRAESDSVGMDRTVSNGTGFAGLYPPQVARIYENISTTPDNLLLWFHHVPWTQRLKSGETVIQHFYNAHYAGAETAQTFVPMWESLKGLIDDERYNHQLFRQQFQAGHSITWRDAIVEFYRNMTGIQDEVPNRAGHHPWRVEAESMTLSGYKSVPVTPFECASNYTAIVTTSNFTAGTAMTTLNYPSGSYILAVNYFDLLGGQAQWQVYLNNKTVGTWKGDNVDTGRLGHAASVYLDGHSATRITFTNVTIAKGDVLKIVGQPHGIEMAPLDYVAVLPMGVVD